MKAIETRYKGYRFRSRLEARWAVFFDALGVRWEYERQGFDLGSAGCYLPDFFIPDMNLWVEVKPDADIDLADWVKVEAFQKELLAKEREASRSDERVGPSESALVCVGTPGYFGGKHSYRLHYSLGSAVEHFFHCPLCRRLATGSVWGPNPRYPSNTEWMAQCMACDIWDRGQEHGRDPYPGAYFHKGLVSCPDEAGVITAELRRAYTAARSARFEHGERPTL